MSADRQTIIEVNRSLRNIKNVNLLIATLSQAATYS
jgi:hypothetical protein